MKTVIVNALSFIFTHIEIGWKKLPDQVKLGLSYLFIVPGALLTVPFILSIFLYMLILCWWTLLGLVAMLIGFYLWLPGAFIDPVWTSNFITSYWTFTVSSTNFLGNPAFWLLDKGWVWFIIGTVLVCLASSIVPEKYRQKNPQMEPIPSPSS